MRDGYIRVASASFEITLANVKKNTEKIIKLIKDIVSKYDF